mmetsp:Transcript_28616/g.78661  ORF Transcript_28616/g.78661 Transcript_28616/m.78661 type:complete len:729 (-) Transcript_28616:120-2306(-)
MRPAQASPQRKAGAAAQAGRNTSQGRHFGVARSTDRVDGARNQRIVQPGAGSATSSPRLAPRWNTVASGVSSKRLPPAERGRLAKAHTAPFHVQTPPTGTPRGANEAADVAAPAVPEVPAAADVVDQVDVSQVKGSPAQTCEAGDEEKSVEVETATAEEAAGPLARSNFAEMNDVSNKHIKVMLPIPKATVEPCHTPSCTFPGPENAAIGAPTTEDEGSTVESAENWQSSDVGNAAAAVSLADSASELEPAPRHSRLSNETSDIDREQDQRLDDMVGKLNALLEATSALCKVSEPSDRLTTKLQQRMSMLATKSTADAFVHRHTSLESAKPIRSVVPRPRNDSDGCEETVISRFEAIMQDAIQALSSSAVDVDGHVSPRTSTLETKPWHQSKNELSSLREELSRQQEQNKLLESELARVAAGSRDLTHATDDSTISALRTEIDATQRQKQELEEENAFLIARGEEFGELRAAMANTHQQNQMLSEHCEELIVRLQSPQKQFEHAQRSNMLRIVAPHQFMKVIRKSEPLSHTSCSAWEASTRCTSQTPVSGFRGSSAVSTPISPRFQPVHQVAFGASQPVLVSQLRGVPRVISPPPRPAIQVAQPPLVQPAPMQPVHIGVSHTTPLRRECRSTSPRPAGILTPTMPMPFASPCAYRDRPRSKSPGHLTPPRPAHHACAQHLGISGDLPLSGAGVSHQQSYVHVNGVHQWSNSRATSPVPAHRVVGVTSA